MCAATEVVLHLTELKCRLLLSAQGLSEAQFDLSLEQRSKIFVFVWELACLPVLLFTYLSGWNLQFCQIFSWSGTLTAILHVLIVFFFAFYASVTATATDGVVCPTPTLVNTISQERRDSICSDLAQTSTWTQR